MPLCRSSGKCSTCCTFLIEPPLEIWLIRIMMRIWGMTRMTKKWTWVPIEERALPSKRRNHHVHKFPLPCVGAVWHKYMNQKFSAGSTIFHVHPKWRIVRCPVCKSRAVIRKGGCTRRRLRTVPIDRKPIWLDVEIPRIFCPECNCVRQIKPWRTSMENVVEQQYARWVYPVPVTVGLPCSR